MGRHGGFDTPSGPRIHCADPAHLRIEYAAVGTVRSTMRPPKRTDCHRPGAIIPADYEFVFSYSLATTQNGWPIPAMGINCEIERRTTDADGTTHNGQHSPDGRCCVIGLRAVAKATFAATGGTGKCSVCGANYVYGDVWRHKGGEHIHIGHDCADKYALLADRSEWELANGRARQAAAVALLKSQRAEERADFLAAHPGLAEDLEVDHPIVQDIAARFRTTASLSDKQVALVRKLADQIRNPPPPETYVNAPTGKVTFRGTVVSVKDQETQYGDTTRITVKVTTDAGVWLAWGTCPAKMIDEARVLASDRYEAERAVLDAELEAFMESIVMLPESERLAALAQRPSRYPQRVTTSDDILRGATVEITATLKPGRDPHFAIMGRPRGTLVAATPE